MRIKLESTDKVVTLNVKGSDILVRVWQGETASGIPCQAYIALIAPELPETHPLIDDLTIEFERDLQRNSPPRAEVAAIPLRLIL